MLRAFLPGLVLLVHALAAAADPEALLELSDCRINAGPGSPGIAARCADLVRPLDPDNPDSGEVSLRVAVVPALSLEPASDPLVPIAGGPGQSSIQFYAGWSAAFERVRRNRDIVLVDQRGTGESAPMVCDIDEDVVDGEYSEAETLRLTEQCLQRLPYDPRYFTTSVAVQDLEALRKALGYSKFNLYGISYGTRVAQHYARRYPDKTRTVLLDGVVPPQLPLGPDIATESQLAVDRVFARCEEDPSCNAAFPDVAGDFEVLRGALAESPVAVEYQHPETGERKVTNFTADHLAGAVRLLLYNPRTVALLPLVISEAANGNFVPLTAQFDMVAASLSDALNIGMHNAVMCTEDAPFIDWDGLNTEAIDQSYIGPLQLESIRTMCSVWPQGVLDDNLRTPLATRLPVLLLSGTADPITPPRFAEMAATDMVNSWHIVGADQGHGLAAVGCMPRIIGEFIEAATLADGTAECMDDAFVMPFFIDFTGPAP